MPEIPDAILDLAAQRVEYDQGRIGQVAADPAAQFAQWYASAEGRVGEPNAMVVATADAAGPDARTVLLKEFDRLGFVFFSNYTSTKGRQLADNPHIALVFPWHDMQRQVRVRGIAEHVSTAQSDDYFAQRNRGSQLGAWASAQSQPVADRATMENAFAAVEAEYAGKDVPRPPHWGGYRVRPIAVEFWQGRESRFHDRFVYTSIDGAPHEMDDGSYWSLVRLNP